MDTEDLIKLLDTSKQAFAECVVQRVFGCYPWQVYSYCWELNSQNDADFKITLAERRGGGEGEGDYAHRVFAISYKGDHKLHYMVQGFWHHACTTWHDEVTIVEPQEVTRIEYLPVTD
mgnify:CR=1 FL=1